MENEPVKLTGNRIFIACLIFFVIAFGVNSFVNYSASTSIEDTLQMRSAVGDEILQVSKDVQEQNKIIIGLLKENNDLLKSQQNKK